MELKRHVYAELLLWKNKERKKPLLVRGARQTGKTFLINKLIQEEFKSGLRINLEKEPELGSIFQSTLKPGEILSALGSLKKVYHPDILFIDEIQVSSYALSALRYFYEDLPEVPVIAAGSLLDFALNQLESPMPVGRVEFLHLYPMSFLEFLQGLNEEGLLFKIKNWIGGKPFVTFAEHQRLLDHFRSYLFVGGMPEAVSQFIQDPKEQLEMQKIQHSLLLSIEADFSKYRGKFKLEALRKVYDRCPYFVGKRVKYSEIDPDFRSADLKQGIQALEKAKIIFPIVHSQGGGVPLAAQAKESVFKFLFLDVGLLNQKLGGEVVSLEKMVSMHEGALAEQFVGQELLALTPSFKEAALFYWAREEKNAQAEVDYLFQHKNQIYPIEVKSGKSQKLKSLLIFLSEKNFNVGVLTNIEMPTERTLPHSRYRLIHLPIYAVCFLREALETSLS